jgi:hypothetical protein
MPTIIAVITQEESEPKLLLNANPTMALPVLAPLFVPPQVPKKKLFQMKLWAEQEDAPAPEPDLIQVPTHYRGSSKVQGYKYSKTPAKSHGNKKKDKAIKSKIKTHGQAKHPGFPKAKADCKETLQLANTLRIKYLKDLVNSF